MLVETLKVKEKTIEIYTEDEFGLNPREWDNLGTMVCFHSRYNLGDKDHGFYDPEEFTEFLENEDVIALPLILLDHSGLWMQTSHFECDSGGWDSGLVGYIFVTHDHIRKEYRWKNLTQKRLQKIQSYLKSEVEIYSMYLEGRVYYFVSTCDRCGLDDSCGGFFGEDWKENGLMDHCDYYCECTERAYNNLALIGE